MPGPVNNPTWRRSELLRLLMLLLLVAATGMLLQTARPAGGRSRWPQVSTETVLYGDLLYRLGQFVQRQSELQPGISWYSGYLLSENGVGLWEREALRPQPDAAALLRVGLVYARNGYGEQGREMLLAAGQADPERYSLYLGLAELYGGQHAVSRAGAVQLPPEESRWLRELVEVDLLQAAGQTEAARTALEEMRRHQDQFGLVLVALLLVVVLLCLVGGVVVVRWLALRLFTLRPRRYRAPLSVPWGLREVTEVLVVLVFLLVLVSVGVTRLAPAAVHGPAGSTARPLLLVLAYVFQMGVVLLMVYSRAAQGSRPWRALGLRWPGLVPAVVQAMRAYGILCCLALAAAWLLQRLGAGLLPAATSLLRGDEGWPGVALLFLLTVVLAPIAEEILFRGFVYGGLRTVMPTGSAAVASALIFSLAHLQPAPEAVAAIAAIGLALALLYERTRSVVPGMLLHALHNLLVFTILLVGTSL